jgi:hypothetical protein
MRIVFGIAAVAILLGSYVVCPDEVRASIADTVTPSEQIVSDVQDGLDALADYLSGPEDIQPETPPV